MFKREVEYVETSILSKFPYAHGITLLNHRDTLLDIPLANKYNLDQTLATIANLMNPEEDLLLLYMTAHGSRDATLSSTLWPIRPEPLTASDVNLLIKKNNIKWRVVIVSACYSGSFIEPLANENTMIITASSSERNSFGCSNDRELTYFAEAYFKYAWPKSNDFVEAYELASEWVTAKELDENKTPSEPQLFVGKNIERYLETIEAGF